MIADFQIIEGISLKTFLWNSEIDQVPSDSQTLSCRRFGNQYQRYHLSFYFFKLNQEKNKTSEPSLVQHHAFSTWTSSQALGTTESQPRRSSDDIWRGRWGWPQLTLTIIPLCMHKGLQAWQEGNWPCAFDSCHKWHHTNQKQQKAAQLHQREKERVSMKSSLLVKIQSKHHLCCMGWRLLAPHWASERSEICIQLVLMLTRGFGREGKCHRCHKLWSSHDVGWAGSRESEIRHAVIAVPWRRVSW